MTIPSSWEMFAQKTGNEAVQSATRFLEETMAASMEEALPYDTFMTLLNNAQEEARNFMKRMVFNIQMYYGPFVVPLDKEIERVSKRLVEQNLNKVIALSIAEADIAENSLEAAVNESILPLSRGYLEGLQVKTLANAMNTFSKRMKPFETIKNYDFSGEHSKLKKHLEGMNAVIREKNVKAIMDVVKDFTDKATKHFSQLEEFADKKSDAEFEQRKNELFSESMDMLKKATEKLSEEPEVKTGVSDLRSSLIVLSEEYYKKNEETIRAYGIQVVAASQQAHRDTTGMVVLPVEDDVLWGLFREGEAKAVKYFDTNMSKYSGSQIFVELRRKLHEEISKLNKAVENHNKEVLKVTLDVPRDKGFKQLREDVKSYWLVMSFRNHARDVFNETIGDGIKSPRLKATVVEDFANEAIDELGSGLHAMNIIVAYGLLTVALVVVGIAFVSKLRS